MDEPRTDIFATPAPADAAPLEVDADELADARRDDAWRAFVSDGERYATDNSRSVAHDVDRPVGAA